jgi:hypothetical protein
VPRRPEPLDPVAHFVQGLAELEDVAAAARIRVEALASVGA